jgi:hypothetical protein
MSDMFHTNAVIYTLILARDRTFYLIWKLGLRRVRHVDSWCLLLLGTWSHLWYTQNLVGLLFTVLRPAQELFTYIWRRHHYRWRVAIFRPMLGAQGLWAGRDLYRATPAVTRDLGFSGLIRRCPPLLLYPSLGKFTGLRYTRLWWILYINTSRWSLRLCWRIFHPSWSSRFLTQPGEVSMYSLNTNQAVLRWMVPISWVYLSFCV